MTPADLVTNEYEQHKAEVIRTVAAKLAGAGVSSPQADLEASYNEAWHALYLTLADGEEVENRVGYLVAVTHRRALNELRGLKASRRVDPDALERLPDEMDLDARLDAEMQLRHVREGFRAKLSQRELEAATLCHVYGFSRLEAARALGVRPKRMEKIMDRASGKINSVLASVQAGEHCAEMGSTVRAYALGLLDSEGEKHKLATEHLRHCPACRRDVWRQRGLAAIGPPLPAAFALLGGGAGGAGAGGSEAGGKASGGAGQGGLVTGLAVAAAVAVAVAALVVAGLATGTIGGGSGETGDSGSTTASSAGANAASVSATDAARAKARAEARAARREQARMRERRRRMAQARERRRAERAAAEAANAAPPEPAYVPEPVYVPPPPPPPPAPPAPEPSPPPPDPKPAPRPEPTAPVDTKPTTDAGEEFGLR